MQKEKRLKQLEEVLMRKVIIQPLSKTPIIVTPKERILSCKDFQLMQKGKGLRHPGNALMQKEK